MNAFMGECFISDYLLRANVQSHQIGLRGLFGARGFSGLSGLPFLKPTGLCDERIRNIIPIIIRMTMIVKIVAIIISWRFMFSSSVLLQPSTEP